MLTAQQKQERFLRFQKLPESLQRAMLSADIARLIGVIASKYGVIDRGSLLAGAIGEVFLGILHPNLFIRTISDRLQLPLERSRALSFEVSSQIFSSVRTDLMQIHGIAAASPSSPQPARQPAHGYAVAGGSATAGGSPKHPTPPAPMPPQTPPARPPQPPPSPAPRSPSSFSPPPRSAAPPQRTPSPPPAANPSRPSPPPRAAPPAPPQQAMQSNTLNLRPPPPADNLR